jgi:hypothetical protein
MITTNENVLNILHLRQKTLICMLSFILTHFYYCACGGTLWHSQKFLQCIKCITFKFIPSTIPAIISTMPLFHLHTFGHSICTIYTPGSIPNTKNRLRLEYWFQQLENIGKGERRIEWSTSTKLQIVRQHSFCCSKTQQSDYH